MQADLWAAYDLIFAGHSAANVFATGLETQRAELLTLLAHLIHKLAPTPA